MLYSVPIIMNKTLTWTMDHLSWTWYYFWKIVSWSVDVPGFLYDNVLTNPIFYGLLLVIVILSILTFSD